MGAQVNYNTVNYKDQRYFDQFFATAFDKYDRNRDGRIDYKEFQPLVNEMCQIITQKYGYGPTVDKIKQAWFAMDTNRSGYITRQEFSTKAKYEVERILSQANCGPQMNYQGQPPYGNQYHQPGMAQPYPNQYGPTGYVPPAQQRRW